MTKTYLISEEMLQRTLNALEDFNEQSKHGTTLPAEIDDCMELLRELLSNPPAEPVAWMYKNRNTDDHYLRWTAPEESFKPIPLFRKDAP
jgi:hypothetical protein